ncbi:hypothetical protein HPP92_012080 [Vanilla planifolia]|uniref:DUF3741 domain-containing protein n=1 Tax=Vanilla planifolia TaxID=51239 RepID=A0A835R1U0_VANPL|nr:hypothetical protein HPP92_012080 [Vanilla planifolia]
MENEKTANKKKQKMQPSTSRRESSPDYRRPRKQAIGCMSGILQLLSRRNTRRRISSPVRNEGLGAIPKTTTTSLPPPQLKSDAVLNDEAKYSVGDDGLTWRSTCQVPRSPMLSSEIRRSGGCFDRAGDSPRRSSALVAKLMGLEEPPIASPVLIGSSPESAEEKRRKLLGALERCDEDLRALKRVIDAVRTAEIIRIKAGGDLEDGEPMTGVTKCPDSYGEQPSPVSVLDAVAFSSPKSRASTNDCLQLGWVDLPSLPSDKDGRAPSTKGNE